MLSKSDLQSGFLPLKFTDALEEFTTKLNVKRNIRFVALPRTRPTLQGAYF
jgi:hypothetical protein